MRHLLTPLILATSVLTGCLERDPVPARPAAEPFGVIGDIELVAHRGGSSMDHAGQPAEPSAPDTPGAQAAPPAWGSTDPTSDADRRPSVPDSRLRLLVTRRLADADIDTDDIDIRIDAGRVILSGTVSSHMLRDRIEVAARSVDDASEVINRIDIAP
jgi:hypothetical protein